MLRKKKQIGRSGWENFLFIPGFYFAIARYGLRWIKRRWVELIGTAGLVAFSHLDR